jgi:hypothetical protein
MQRVREDIHVLASRSCLETGRVRSRPRQTSCQIKGIYLAKRGPRAGGQGAPERFTLVCPGSQNCSVIVFNFHGIFAFLCWLRRSRRGYRKYLPNTEL